jgi:hypothetical protein
MLINRDCSAIAGCRKRRLRRQGKAGCTLQKPGRQPPLFVSRRSQIVTLAARHAVPAMYVARDFAEAGGPSERPQFRFLNQHHLPGLTQINEPRGISVYAFSMEATEPNERLAGASNTEHRKCPLRNFTSATASKTRKLTSAAALPLSTARLNVKARLSRSYSTDATKRSTSRLTVFAKSQRGSHECRHHLHHLTDFWLNSRIDAFCYEICDQVSWTTA